MNKKLFAVLFLSILLLSFASAIQKDYNPSTKTLRLNHNFLFINTGDIAEVQLLTPLKYKVGLGYQKVWEMRISGFDDYNDFITQMDLYDVKNGMAKFSRDYDLKKREVELVLVQDYKKVCSESFTNLNGTIEYNCLDVENGSHYEERVKYTKLQRVDFKKNDELIVAMFTEVEDGDKVEWIPTIAGLEIPEWAEWTADLNTNIDIYFKTDEPSGTTAIDSVKNYNGTITGATLNQAGKINKTYEYDGAGDYINGIRDFNGASSDFSFSFWINTDVVNLQRIIISSDINNGAPRGMQMSILSDGKLQMYDGSIVHLSSAGVISASTWYHVIWTNTGADGRLYLDSININNYTTSFNNVNKELTIGTRNSGLLVNDWDGKIDEIGIWNRVLTQAEATQLYNSGNGITYTNQFEEDLNVTAISPANLTLYKISPIVENFTCYGSDGENFTEMEFYLNGVLNESNSSGLNNTNYVFQKTLTDGEYNWSCTGYDNDANSISTGTRFLTIDTTPFIEFISPTPTEGEIIKVDSVTANINLTETYFFNLTFYLYNSSGLVESVSYINSTRQNTFSNLEDGSYSINATIDTTTGKSNLTKTINFLVHTSQPVININSPTGLSDFFKDGNNETLKYSISEIGENITHFRECWLEYNETEVLLNVSDTGSDPRTFIFPSNYANVTQINTRNFAIPYIFTNIPEDCSGVGNFTIIDRQSGLNRDLYCLDQSLAERFIGSVFVGALPEINITAMQRRPLNCSETLKSFEYVLGENNLCVHAIDIFGLHSENVTSWEYKIIELDTIYNNETEEGSSEDFEISLRVKSGLSLSSAIFHYGNYTDIPSISSIDGNYSLFLDDYMIPNVENTTNITFFFEVTLSDSTQLNTTALIQNVKSIEIDDCSSYSNLIYSLDLKDEETYLNLTGEIDVVLEIIPVGNGVIMAEYSNEFSSVQFKSICSSVNLSDSNLLLNSIIRYGSENYTSEFYHIQKASLSDYPKNIELYSLPLDKSTEFKVTYQNEDLIKVAGAVVQLLRQRFDTGSFILVEAPLTSTESTAVLHINEEANKYKINIVKDGVLLDSFDDLVFKCDNELTGECNFDLFQLIDAPNLIPVETLLDFSYSIQSDDDSITIPFTIPSGTPNNIRVELRQKKITGMDLNCNTSVYSSAGSITCGFNESIDESSLELKIFKAGDLQAERGFVVREDLAGEFGKNNLFIVLILLFSLVGMFIASPEWQIIISVVVLILAGSMWLLNGMNLVVGLGGLAWLIVIAVILIKEISKQEDR